MGIPYPIPYRKRHPDADQRTTTPTIPITNATPTPTTSATSAPITNPTPAPMPSSTTTTTTPQPDSEPHHQPQAQHQTQPHPEGANEPESLYLTYSTTLSLPLLSHLCPTARFIGRAILRGYKWHVSILDGRPNLVVANDKRSRVEGLVWLVSDDQMLGLEGWERGVTASRITTAGGNANPNANVRRVSADAEIISGHPALVGRTVRDIRLRPGPGLRLVPEASTPRGKREVRTLRVSLHVRIFGNGTGGEGNGGMMGEWDWAGQSEGVLGVRERAVLEAGVRDAVGLGVTERWVREVVYPRLLMPVQGQGQVHGQNETQG